MSNLILFWHRRDLRISDNVGLAAGFELSPKLVGVFCLDPTILERDDIAPARVTYMIGCLQQLQQSYRQAGSQLLILHQDPRQGIPNLAAALEAKAVCWNWDVEPYSKERDQAVAAGLKEKGIAVYNYWDQLLHAPGDIFTKSGNPYSVYTPFWKNWQGQSKAQPVATLSRVESLTEIEQDHALAAGVIDLPSARDLGYVWENELLVPPGEKVAQEILEKFCDRTIGDYQEQRNFPGVDGTSKLSAALKFGVIGIRTVWQAAQNAYNLSRSDEARQSIQTWQQELAWREFYQHAMYFFPELAQGPYRQKFQDFPWENNPEFFQAWCEGKTGYPIVDAAMRQLNQTGWMHNRCRMIVASFLTKDLIINWQWGEKYFMQRLWDGDLSANNGGWQWSASSGMDPKPLRIFNPASQAKKFDPDGEYIREWLPELSSVDTEYVVTGKIPESDREMCGYPAPIVDHNQQQRRFKELYKELQ
ncbi:MAG: deoxyribodipyrimidine photolyase [Moorea sp. SIO3I7]|uniref:FAD-binding domain-containing protein n=1 Tax=unclassified Moorena TaxID=2683338 RepID=UPI0013BEE753|nr:MULTISPECIES: FAD-binding domain-containing protein [unclassified Moorena]NEN98282.1 deoxyribodipyrimidine photolyase [Moorena sp. SIO3I7]NEO05429.1 deoxyribodipyrimidine photolyase [Moorena sp. SIO3I8]NEO22916.1 deoxyribodipyrimidine photolyase [Moorena sp. SIO4A5]NEQ61934.1 deoxyribodipyrimidine photolyase [Moorena sp. SIO4A1]